MLPILRDIYEPFYQRSSNQWVCWHGSNSANLIFASLFSGVNFKKERIGKVLLPKDRKQLSPCVKKAKKNCVTYVLRYMSTAC